MSVGLSIEFIEQMGQLPNQIRKKMTEFLGKFMSNPNSPGLNLELVKGSYKQSLYSVRVDQDYRGIIGRPSKDVWMLLWVDKHDDAYYWAEGRRCEVNPQTGALQVYSVRSFPEPPKVVTALEPTIVKKDETKIKGLFDPYSTQELERVGVPKELVQAVRALKTEGEFEVLLPSLPKEVSDPLYMMAAGYSFEDVLAHLEYSKVPTPVDVDDVAAALKRHESKRVFHVLESEKELMEMLNASIQKWRIFLHPSQRKLVERDWNGPVRVLGGAGTGKTVVAMHRVKWLLEQRYKEKDQRILFTTFTKNLAADIKTQLGDLLPGRMDQVEVVNLDLWTANYLKENKLKWTLFYGGSSSTEWKEALAERDSELELSDSFYRDEWEQIVQAQGIDNESGYLSARRAGRGTSLTAYQRRSVWKVFGAYRSKLIEERRIENEDAMRLVAEHISLNQAKPRYESVIVDEAQDLGFQAFRLLRAIAGAQRQNDLFIVGDPHQRIYEKVASLSKSGIEVRGRAKKLWVNYRTTEEIRKAAIQVLGGITVDDLDEGRDDQKGYHSLVHGPSPLHLPVKDFNDECDQIIKVLKTYSPEGDYSTTCVVARKKEYCEQIAAYLENKGITVKHLDKHEDTDSGLGVRVATMHRVKGLEFDRVIVTGLVPGTYPLPMPDALDGVSQMRWKERENALLYVSMTRARKEVVLLERKK